MIKCLIVEDEPHAADDLEMMLLQSGFAIEIAGRTDTVKKTVEWLKNNTAQLIFLDIQLRNTLCFEIFDHIEVRTPVVFTTSYSQYAVKPLEANNLAYLLKPIEEEELLAALHKYQRLYGQSSVLPEPVNDKIIPLHASSQKRFLVQSGKGIKSVTEEEVAFFRVQKNYVLLTTKDSKQYILASSLDTLEQRLDPKKFFRINRQFIVSFDAIDVLYPLGKGRLKLTTVPASREEIIVGAERASDFKTWLNQ